MLGRRVSLVAGAALGLASTSASSGAAEAVEPPRITHRVFLDIGVCPSIVRADRALGGGGGLCAEPTSLGRVEIGLYGDLVPNVVSHFLELVEAPPGRGYKGTVFHRVKPGRYVLAGQAGSARMGQVQAPRFPPNPELLAPASFQQKHLRPGTVSLALAAATGDGEVGSMSRNSAQTEFLITTGPAPVPSLDGTNVVFGRVTKGLEVVTKIAATPTFAPSGNSVAWNQVAEWVGDDRAAKARESWSKPTMAVAITDAGVIPSEEERTR
jgi:peptidyl-prolyl cis-trans isomerase B (cyclophilin B)